MPSIASARDSWGPLFVPTDADRIEDTLTRRHSKEPIVFPDRRWAVPDEKWDVFFSDAKPTRPTEWTVGASGSTFVLPGFWNTSQVVANDQAWKHWASIGERLKFLQHDAAEEGGPYSEASSGYLHEFLNDLRPEHKPALFRLPIGNVRALWEDAQLGSQIGLQFLPEGTVQYVILRETERGTLKSIGIETADAVRSIVRVLGLRYLWFRGQR